MYTNVLSHQLIKDFHGPKLQSHVSRQNSIETTLKQCLIVHRILRVFYFQGRNDAIKKMSTNNNKKALGNHEPPIYRWGNWSSEKSKWFAQGHKQFGGRSSWQGIIYINSLMWIATKWWLQITQTFIPVTISPGVHCRPASCIKIQYSTAIPMTAWVFILLFLYYNSGGNRLSGWRQKMTGIVF